tara:strand:- start:243 stop:1214 length:972 start_codon:yes stop_codon:yes gene_type:complete
MSEPLISIIIPVLNGEKFIYKCFFTIENQNYSNLEIIFIDNGSSDNSRKIINKYCLKKNNYFLLDCIKPGPGAARNKGIEFCNGKYFSFLDVDDLLDPEKFKILLEEFEKFPNIMMAFGETQVKYYDGRERKIDLTPFNSGINLSPDLANHWLNNFHNHPHISSLLISREIILPDLFPENIIYGEDIAFSVKIAMEYPISYSKKLVSVHYRHPESSISKANLMFSNTERYLQFYEKFALPFFYKNSINSCYKYAYVISENIAYRLLMKLIYKYKKNHFFSTLKKLENQNLIKKNRMRSLLYHLLPYVFANYLNDKFLKNEENN